MCKMCLRIGGQYFSSTGGTQWRRAEQLLAPGSRPYSSSARQTAALWVHNAKPLPGQQVCSQDTNTGAGGDGTYTEKLIWPPTSVSSEKTASSQQHLKTPNCHCATCLNGTRPASEAKTLTSKALIQSESSPASKVFADGFGLIAQPSSPMLGHGPGRRKPHHTVPHTGATWETAKTTTTVTTL